MKRSLYHKWRTLFFVFLCSMAFISVSALAQQDDAQRISLDGELQIHTSKSRSADGNLTDGEEATYLSFVANDTITVKLGKEMQGLYLQWHMLPPAYEVEWKSEEGKRIEQEKRRPFVVNEYVAIPVGAKEFTLRFSGKTELSEISAYGDGNLPESLQQWEMPKTQPAIMLLCGYPGDELLYFGGLVPYCVNQGIPFTVAYMSSYDRVRQEECLSALWSLGVHQAPVFLERGTKHNKDVSYLLLNWKKTASIGVVRNMLIEYEPRVVISFGEEGITERLYAYRDSFRKQRCFGEAQTAATGQIVEEAVKAAAKIKNGFRIDKLFAVTDTPGATFLDLSEPLGYYHDKTGNEVAAEAYETYYRSMSTFHYSVKTELQGDLIRGSAEGNTIRDLLSGISYEPDHEPVPTATPVPTVTPAPTETPAPTATIMPTETPRMTPVQTVVPTGAEMEKTPFPTMLVPMACVSLAAFVFALTVLRKRLKHGIWIAILAILFVTFLVFAGVVIARMLHFRAGPGLEDTVAEELYFQEPERQTVPHPTMVPTPITGEAEGNLQDETAIEQGKTEEPAVSRYEEHFLHSDTEEEVITVDVENGFWSYQSHDFAVFIKRYQETGGKYTQEEQPLVWFVADIYMREGVDAFRSPFSDEGRSGRTTVMPWQFSRTYKSILFVNGDNMLNMDVELKGTIIRDGHVYSATNKAADVLAWNRRSQRFDYYEKSGYTAQQLMEAGYQDTFSFGPIVLLDGVICTEACKASNVHMLNPRCGVGTAEDGHTVAIVVDGRRPRYSVGVDLLTYAQMFLDYGCTDAYNLDGGVSSCMYFMGEQLNSHGNKKDFSQQRHMPDGLTFGYSELVPTVNDPIYNDGTDRNAVEADYH